MTFEEWFVENKQWDNYEDPVKAAWDYQQARIDELEEFVRDVAAYNYDHPELKAQDLLAQEQK